MAVAAKENVQHVDMGYTAMSLCFGPKVNIVSE